tara:strand:- start:115 stop:576 length:462 start_codon:yes stop_codon:yes gene_type:complete
VYIGRTTRTLNQRLREHKNDYKTRVRTCRSRDIIKNGDYRIELIEETDDKSRERWWIENTDCVNISTPGRTREEWREDNKDKIKEYRREYYQDNKDHQAESQKEYREKNKEKTKDYNKEYYTARKDWFSSMCGSPYRNNMSLLKIDPDLFNQN